MATVDEDLKTFLQADAAITKEVGSRIHENHVPMKTNPDGSMTFVAIPFIYFVQNGEIREDCVDDTAGSTPEGIRFILEVVANSIGHVRRIAASVVARLHLYAGTFGSQTIQLTTCEDQADDYEDRAGAVGRGYHSSGFNVEVYFR